MSEFSGKCDFKDYIDIWIGDAVEGESGKEENRKEENKKEENRKEENKKEEQFKNFNIYVDWNVVPLRIQSIKDCVPYYPYLVTIATTNNNVHNIILSSTSFVDEEEKGILERDKKRLLKYYKKCKREHIPYTVEGAIKNCIGDWYKPPYIETLAERIAEHGEKASIKGLHTVMAQYYRKALYEEMLKVGYEKEIAWWWVYKEFLPINKVSSMGVGNKRVNEKDIEGKIK